MSDISFNFLDVSTFQFRYAMEQTLKKESLKKKTPRYFFLITILIPILFFILLETGLRIFHYGFDTEQWISPVENKLMLNQDIARRYFHTLKNIPTSNQDIFDTVKKTNAFRVFVLGESSGAGYPYSPTGAFSRWLQKRLEILYPDCTIEIVNLSMTAINSYTMRDLFPGVIEQQPDLILIYAGHNEYYGALGVGSTESFGGNRTLVNVMLFFNRFKTIELLRNAINSFSTLLSSKSPPRQDGTLMSRIAKDQYIEYHSKEYQLGLDQYRQNMHDILESAKNHGIPVILGTLASNLKDQKPFISSSTTQPSAQSVFDSAKVKLQSNNHRQADSLFRLAKDLDVLRFRAPEEINSIIQQLGSEFGYAVVHIDSAFNALSPDGIVGDNLMTDHLHPTLHGYELMAKFYFEAMQRGHLLPRCNTMTLSEHELDSTTRARFTFTRFDSVIAKYRIMILKNDWPYIGKKDRKNLQEFIATKDYIEETALKFLNDNEPWETAQRKAAGWYLTQKDYVSFQRQMDVLISQYPVIVEYYDFAANELLKAEHYDAAYSFLIRRYHLSPNAYSTKWLGIINLSKNNTAAAIHYLEESIKYDGSDPQVWYNISGAFSYSKEYKKALDAVDQCLTLNPSFPKAANLRAQLERTLH